MPVCALKQEGKRSHLPGTAIGAAREKVRIAKALKTLPKISEAFRIGSISYSKVRAMTRVAAPESEDFLLNVARYGTASHLEKLVRNFRKVKRIEALAEEKARHDSRQIQFHENDDGTWAIRGRVTAKQAAILRKAFQVAMDETFEERKDVSAETSDDPIEPLATRRADALVRVAESYLAGDRPGKSGDRNLIHVRVDADTLSDQGECCHAEIDDCGCVPAETARRMSCDAAVIAWKEDENGDILNVGRKTRTIPPSIRRALERREGGCCTFPGCTCIYKDAHHVVHWAHGGETKLENLTLLCRRHHALVHEGRFSVQMMNGRATFFNPNGIAIPTSGDRNLRGNVTQLRTQNHNKQLDITPKTTQSKWTGERMDHHLAVSILCQIEEKARRSSGGG